MTIKVSLLTTHDAFTDLHQIADTRRSSVKVDREALLQLLIDHSVMTKALHCSNSFDVVMPVPERKRLLLR